MKTDHEPIAEPVDRAGVLAEIDELRKAGPLATQGPLDVFLAPADAIPNVLLEIGRLREVTFRAVGEGSGKARDLDRYDEYYLHLFLWDREKECLAGGYRLGRTDLILAEFGFDGLYSASICEFDHSFLSYLDPALELGRSWVLPDYQRSLHSLFGLWKGIGAFVVRYPRYHKLFGAVSISDDYTAISQDLIVRYFRKTKLDENWQGAVKPILPFLRENKEDEPPLASVEEVSAEVSRHEPDGKGIPVLLRQYFKMNATLLEFVYDPNFQHCLDAMVLVDLHKAPPILLQKYMGREGYEIFANHREGHHENPG
jgi:putative hemolysin